MKKYGINFFILLLTLLFVFPAQAQSDPVPLAGEYYIPQGTHDQGFENLGEALATLNQLGASGAVIFYIDDDLDESENTLLISRQDLTESTSLLIKPAPGKTPTITVTRGEGGDRAGSTGFSIERAHWVTIDGSNEEDGDSRDLTILFDEGEDAPPGSVSIMTIYSTVDNITVKNTNVTHAHGEMGRGVLIDRSAGQDSLVQNVTLHNVSIGEENQVITTAVFLNGVFGTGDDPNQADLMDNITITESNIFGTRWCIYVQSASNLDFQGNHCVINGYSAVSTQSQRAGIQLQLAKDANVSGNTITFGDINYQTDAVGIGGIFLNRNHGPLLISNNMINFSNLINTGSGTEYTIGGITSHNPAVIGLDPEYHIYHNTILLNSPAEEVGKHVGIGPIVEVLSGRFHFKNNIVVNLKDAENSYAIEDFLADNANEFAYIESDYNNLYVTGDASVGYWDGEARKELGDWQLASGLDFHSVSVDVEFVFDTDLRLAGESIGNFALAGIPLKAVPTDIDGKERDLEFPYMGAYEGDVQLVPDRITIGEPPGGDASLLQPFPLVFNMDTDFVDWRGFTFFPFAGADLARIVNPDKSGLNETDYVLEYTKPEGSDAWAGFFYHLEHPVNLTDESVFKLKVWSPRADIEAIMKLEVEGGPGMPDQIADVTVAGEWVELEWNLSEQDHEIAWDKVTVIMDLDEHPVPETETWYLDDFSLEGAVELDPDHIVIVEPPDGDASLLQPFPLVFNMDTEIVDWEGYTFFPFAGAELARIVNPDKSGLNETDYVLEYTKPEGSDAWAGFFYHLEHPVNLTDESVFKLKVWSPRADIEAIMKLEVEGGPGMPDQIADVTVAGEWVELEWDLSEQDHEIAWDKVTVIMDLDEHPVPDTETWYLDDFSLEGVVELDPDRIVIVEPPDGDASLLQPFPLVFNMDTDVVDWEDYTFFPFSGAELARITNPDKSGLNETDYVLEYTKPEGSDAWAGFFYHLEEPINVTDQSVFKLNVWSPRADIEAIMKLEVQGGPATGDLKADVTVAGEWVELVWDLSGQNQETNWDLVVVIMDLDEHPVPETETWYLDDFRLEEVIAVSVDRLADTGIPDRYELSQNYPNPFNPSTTIRFALPEASNVQLEIYNVMGQRVNTLIRDEMYNAGIYEVVWNGLDQNNLPVASGMYIYRITAGEFTEVKSMMFLK